MKWSPLNSQPSRAHNRARTMPTSAPRILFLCLTLLSHFHSSVGTPHYSTYKFFS